MAALFGARLNSCPEICNVTADSLPRNRRFWKAAWPSIPDLDPSTLAGGTRPTPVIARRELDALDQSFSELWLSAGHV